jgi:hypothetical protein
LRIGGNGLISAYLGDTEAGAVGVVYVNNANSQSWYVHFFDEISDFGHNRIEMICKEMLVHTAQDEQMKHYISNYSHGHVIRLNTLSSLTITQQSIRTGITSCKLAWRQRRHKHQFREIVVMSCEV